MSAFARAEDDKANLADLHQAARAVKEAKDALKSAMVGQGPRQRETFFFQVGFALGRLRRITERISPAREEPPSFTCPRCGAVSYNPNDIAHRYCGACHIFAGDTPDAP